MGDVTPDQIANFDQALADVENNLDVLIDLWRTGDPDSPEHVRIAGLCVALGDSEWDRVAFVEILVAAIRRLDRAGQAATPEPPLMIWRDGEVTPVTAATPDGPRRWALPDEPGPEVTAVRGGSQTIYRRVGPHWQDGAHRVVESWWEILADGPLADATPAAGGQDGDGRG